MTTIERPTSLSGATPLRRRKRPRPSGWHWFLAPVALIFLLPFIQMFLASVSPAKELVLFPPPFFPSRLTLDGFTQLFQQSNVLLWLGNTTIVAASAILSHLVLCSLAGYGFARLKFRGRTFGFFAIVATIMIPTQLLMIPTYVLFARIGLIDTLGAAIVPWLATAFVPGPSLAEAGAAAGRVRRRTAPWRASQTALSDAAIVPTTMNDPEITKGAGRSQ